jgi:aminoglycoside phosphotransferase family enzyme/predicted kinase
MSSAPVVATAPRTAGSDASEPPEIHETHTGMVVLIGDRAYKAKKPIVTDFLDFRSVQSREAACEREVRLNSRLAGDSYLGVAHLAGPTDGESEPVVVMRRYSDTFRLASMVRRGESVERHLSAIAAMIAHFHADAARSREIDTCARIPATRQRWQENLDVLGQHVAHILDPAAVSETHRLAMQFIEARAVLFEQRITERRIIDGHGDLIADDIFCLPDGPVLLDCLEFDDRLRYVDGLDDVCFLAMDLEFLGRPDLADFLLDEYRQRAGDCAPPALAHFFIAYRAVVRAKVDCIRTGQGHAEAATDARAHLALARKHLRAGTVRMILVGGGPGSGKTTVARALGEHFSAEVISSDDVRREMQDAGEIDGASGDYNAGLYSADKIDAVYEAMLRRARPQLAAGQSVILDGTWRDARLRANATELARQESCSTVELACVVPLEVAAARIAQRSSSTSDATPHIAAEMAHEHHPWAEAHHIDTSRPFGESLVRAQELCCLTV